jgi:hypothetical protein
MFAANRSPETICHQDLLDSFRGQSVDAVRYRFRRHSGDFRTVVTHRRRSREILTHLTRAVAPSCTRGGAVLLHVVIVRTLVLISRALRGIKGLLRLQSPAARRHHFTREALQIGNELGVAIPLGIFDVLADFGELAVECSQLGSASGAGQANFDRLLEVGKHVLEQPSV